MGINFSSLCCTCYNARLPTEEDDFIGIRNEVRHKNAENAPWPFQDYLKRHTLDQDSSLLFLENPNIDYFTTENKMMQRSAILEVHEIPQIPSPSADNLNEVSHKHKRSVSLSIFTSKNSKFTPLFMPNQRQSIGNA